MARLTSIRPGAAWQPVAVEGFICGQRENHGSQKRCNHLHRLMQIGQRIFQLLSLHECCPLNLTRAFEPQFLCKRNGRLMCREKVSTRFSVFIDNRRRPSVDSYNLGSMTGQHRARCKLQLCSRLSRGSYPIEGSQISRMITAIRNSSALLDCELLPDAGATVTLG